VAAGAHMARPPEAWTLNMKTPSLGLLARSLHGVRDVVELEVEDELRHRACGPLDRPRSLGREELRADLEARHLAGERIHEAGRAVERVDVERRLLADPRQAVLGSRGMVVLERLQAISSFEERSMPPTAAWAPSTVV